MPESAAVLSMRLEGLAKEAGRLIRRFAEENGADRTAADILEASMQLISFLEESGHVCVNLDAWEKGVIPWDEAKSFPALESWKPVLEKSMLVGKGDRVTPFVLMGERLYLYRLWKAEKELAALIHARLTADITTDLTPYRNGFTECFPEYMEKGTVDWQAVAAFSALRYQFSVITGGPGTGKTTTVARIIRILRATHKEIEISLAAPTGKAAVRMDESLASAKIEGIAGAKTIHRLLAVNRNGEFRHNADNLLGTDVLIVDECSMIDLELFNAIFKALSPKTRLILVGDSGQLASINAGTVLGDLCKTVDSFTSEGKHSAFVKAFKDFCGVEIPTRKETGLLVDCVTKLLETYRSKNCPTSTPLPLMCARLRLVIQPISRRLSK